MQVEQMTHEELAEVVRDFREKMLNSGGRAWSLTIPAKETDPDIMLTEIESRLRNSIPKPVVEVKEAGDGDAELWVNGEFIIVASRSRVKVIHDQLNDALGLEGGGDE